MAVPLAGLGTALDAGRPVALFSARIAAEANRAQYAVSRDGRFLVNEVVEESTISPITLLLNWKP